MTTAPEPTMGIVPRRIIVTRHAVEQARSRYNRFDFSPSDVRRDVEEAIAAGREGVRLPREIDLRGSKRGRKQNARYVWTEDLERAYTLKRVRDERNGHEPAVIVVTAVQGAKQ